jgi:hypothetical protein
MYFGFGNGFGGARGDGASQRRLETGVAQVFWAFLAGADLDSPPPEGQR